MDQEASKSLARAAERLFELGRADSALALLRNVTPSLLNREQLRQLKAQGEERNDLDLSLSMTRHLIVKLKGADTAEDKQEYDALIGSDLGALAMLHNLPKAQDPVKPVAGRLMYLLHHSLPYLSNGYATRGHGMAVGMKAAGIDLICVTRPGFPLDIKRDLSFAPPSDTVDGVQYHRLPEPRWTGPGRSRTYIRDAADAIEEQIRLHRPQAIMAASNYIAALPALIAARRCGIPMTYEVRGFWEITNASREPGVENSMAHQLKIRIDSKLAAMADQVFTLSNTMKAELVRRNVPADKIALLPNCCDPDVFTPRPRDANLAQRLQIPDDVPVIGYIGSFVDYEGLDDLTRACGTLKKQGLNFRLVLVGASEGPIHERIKAIAEQQELGEWLILPGRVPHEEVESWYSLIDIAPFPRKPVQVTELVTPLKPLEAMAMEKAVIMSSVAAMAEMVEHSVTGIVFSKGSVASLTAALSLLLIDPKLRETIGQNARQFILKERSWKQMGQKANKWLASS